MDLINLQSSSLSNASKQSSPTRRTEQEKSQQRSQSTPTDKGDTVLISEEAVTNAKILNAVQARQEIKEEVSHECPEIASPIQHTTTYGNSFSFKTIKDTEGANHLVVDITTKDGKEWSLNVTQDTIISENEYGQLTIDAFSGEGTEDNDIIINFSSQETKKVNAKGGDDFVLSLYDDDFGLERKQPFLTTVQNEKGEVEVVGANFTPSNTILTGDGNDTVYVVGGKNENHSFSYDKDYTISTGAGDDSVIVAAGNDQTTSKGMDIDVDTGTGDDHIQIDSLHSGYIKSGSGNDTVSIDNVEGSDIPGAYCASINLGEGDDQLSIKRLSHGYIRAGDGDDVLTLGTIKNSWISTGKGNNTVTADRISESAFKCFGGEVEFDFSEIGKDVKAFHMSEKTAESLKKAAGDARINFVQGGLKDYSFNAVLNSSQKMPFEDEVKNSELMHILFSKL